jgi:dTDP-glucose 4,6-dehydratase
VKEHSIDRVPSAVLISGGAGFIGSHVVKRLIALGSRVVCIDNFLTGRQKNLAGLDKGENLVLVDADVCEPVDKDLTDGVEWVLHLASPASPGRSPFSYMSLPFETLAAGSKGTWNLLEVAEREKARFVLASTSEVYGDPEISPQPESYWGNVNPIGPRSVYDEAKRFAEALAMAYSRERDLDVKIARIFNTYGPGMRPDDGRVVSNMVVQGLKGERLTVYGDGSQTRSFCYIDDMVEGLIRLASSDHKGPMNLGNPEEFSIIELAELIRELIPQAGDIEFLELPPDDPKQRRPDISLAKQVLDWTPEVALRDGLIKTIDWYSKEIEE